MTSIERIIAYTQLSAEPMYNQKLKPPYVNWPEKAHISFNNVSMNYGINKQNKTVSININKHFNMKMKMKSK